MNSTPQIAAAEAAMGNAPTQESPFAQVAHVLADCGYSVVPIMPGEKRPGRFVHGRWMGMTEWTKLATAPMSERDIEEAATWPGAGIGIVLGGAGGLLCVDVDTDDPAIIRAIEDALPSGSLLVKRRGSKGYGAFLRQPGAGEIESEQWDVAGSRVLDLLSRGKQVVVPPTIHPKTGSPYCWDAPDFALNKLPSGEVPLAPDDLVARLSAAIAPFQCESDKASRPVAPRRAPSADGRQGPWRVVNDAALENPAAWVPDLIPAEYLTRNAGGYRAKPFWRGVTDNYKVGIHPSGIVDFASDDRFTAIDLVTTIRKCLPGEARDWLAQRLGIDQPALGGAASRLTPEFFKPQQAANDGPPGDEARAPVRRKLFTRAGELTANPTPVKWLVTDLVEAEIGGMLVADPGVGKTFLALGIAHAVATGRACYGHEAPTPGAVFYVAGEGHVGIARRLAALEAYHGDAMGDAPLFISRTAVIVDNAESLAALRDELTEHLADGGEPVRLVVLDTLARCSAGDENVAQDASAFWHALDELRNEFKCAILVVHHTGHTAKDRGRGSMAHTGAADFIHMLARDNDERLVLSCVKAKDSEPFAPLTFRLQSVPLPAGWGTAPDGKLNTSCVLIPTASALPDASKLNASQRRALETVIRELAQSKSIAKKDAKKALRDSGFSDHRRSGEALRALVERGFLSERDERIEQCNYTEGAAAWAANVPVGFRRSVPAAGGQASYDPMEIIQRSTPPEFASGA